VKIDDKGWYLIQVPISEAERVKTLIDRAHEELGVNPEVDGYSHSHDGVHLWTFRVKSKEVAERVYQQLGLP
jgi:transcription antitermination factor NusG